MTDETKRFRDRFQTLFDKEGLQNIKFFVRSGAPITLADFVLEASKIQDTIAAGEVENVASIDKDFKTGRFDAPF